MAELVKRLTPKPETLRELFLKSGNLCAFPGCGQLMMNADGIFIGQLCHIEAAEVGGERFNQSMTNESRRQASNLMLMCYAHHQVTNDVIAFPVARLRKIKDEHEQRFSEPDRAILDRLTDTTSLATPSTVQNLQRMNKVLRWNSGADELAELANELNAYANQLEKVPLNVRNFLGALVKRAHKMRNSGAVESRRGTKILVSDIEGAFALSQNSVANQIAQLEVYGLGDVDEIDTDLGLKAAVRIYDLPSGWPLWPDIAEFCESASEPLEAFAEKLDFARLDT